MKAYCDDCETITIWVETGDTVEFGHMDVPTMGCRRCGNRRASKYKVEEW